MAVNILQTKLFIPPAQANYIPRPRLTALLDQLNLPERKFVLVSAPAGYGKTTLLSNWIHVQDRKTCWISLDESDNQPVQFFSYLLAALEKIGVLLAPSTKEILKMPSLPVNETVQEILKDMNAFVRHFIIVLDDFHLITVPALHEAVRQLINSLPVNASLVIISRQDPPFPMARLRASGQLIEIRQGNLQFTTEEAVAFFKQTMSLNLSVEQVAILEEKTEGWIAGLQMAALALQSNQDPEKFLQDFSGTHRFILDYLIEEVLNEQPERIQNFLNYTSILNQLNAALCETILDDELYSYAVCQEILKELEDSNLFIIPLDETRQWYRYHHLFAELLITRLKFNNPHQWTLLHKRASSWFDHHQESKLALDHALKAKDFELAADLLEKYVIIHWRTTDLSFFLTVKHIPEEILMGRPALCLQNAWAGVITGQLGVTRKMLETVQKKS